ncbi:MAG: cold shock domain-containing protein [Planctomycetaceae bacterium]
MPTGTIASINSDRGYGFISHDGVRGDTFFHCSVLTGGLVFSSDIVGSRVQFDIGVDPRSGRERAQQVRPESV